MRPRAEEIPINDVSVLRWVKAVAALAVFVCACVTERRESKKAIHVVSFKCENELMQIY